jgi:predicted alpha/beta hydrolase family esterase
MPGNVVGALLVAPPDVDRSTVDPRVGRFGPTPRTVLPFPAILVASSDDPHSAPDRAEDLAASLGAEFVLVEGEGHLNAASGLGTWSEGQELLDRLLDTSTRRQQPALAALPHAASRERIVRRL